MDNVFGFWLAGISISGFFFLALWIRQVDAYSNKRDTELQTDISSKVSLSSCTDTLRAKDTEITNSIKDIKLSVDEIKSALLGTLDKKGIKTTQNEHEQRIGRLETKTKKKG